jgi:predicted Fe-Mo cluster-binding NifX family protein
MKLAIPTDEGLKISTDFRKAKGFLILTVKLGAISEEEMKWNPAGEQEISRETLASRIKGCSVLIVRAMDPEYCMELKENFIECILTKEDIITNIMVHYLENEFRKASDTCCCP